jgi:hypothetical protein
MFWAEVLTGILSVAGFLSLGWYFNEVEKDEKHLGKLKKSTRPDDQRLPIRRFFFKKIGG